MAFAMWMIYAKIHLNHLYVHCAHWAVEWSGTFHLDRFISPRKINVNWRMQSIRTHTACSSAPTCATVIYGWHIQYLVAASVVESTKMIRCHSLYGGSHYCDDSKWKDEIVDDGVDVGVARSFFSSCLQRYFVFSSPLFFLLGHDNETMARILKALAIWVESSRVELTRYTWRWPYGWNCSRFN